jgi:hypothetical protein
MMPITAHAISFTIPGGRLISTAIIVAAVGLSGYLYLQPAFREKKPRNRPALAPRQHAADNSLYAGLPYPPDVLPGGRDVRTPYGGMRVFEWGSEEGDKVLLMHGIGTPCLALGDLAGEFVDRGYRVMLFGKSLVCGLMEGIGSFDF